MKIELLTSGPVKEVNPLDVLRCFCRTQEMREYLHYPFYVAADDDTWLCASNGHVFIALRGVKYDGANTNEKDFFAAVDFIKSCGEFIETPRREGAEVHQIPLGELMQHHHVIDFEDGEMSAYSSTLKIGDAYYNDRYTYAAMMALIKLKFIHPGSSVNYYPEKSGRGYAGHFFGPNYSVTIMNMVGDDDRPQRHGPVLEAVFLLGDWKMGEVKYEV